MKKITTFLAIGVLLIACEKSNVQTTNSSGISEKELSERTIDSVVMATVDSAANAADYEAAVSVNGENPKVKKAKNLIDESTGWMNKAIKGEISQEAANKKINPLMEEFQKINSTLSSNEQEHLKNYRIEQAQKSIDLQVQYSK